MGKYNANKKFEEVLIGAVDEAFLTLGDRVKTALYFSLEQKFYLKRIEIPDRIDDFSDALEKIFGMASKHLEILIMKKLNEKVSCSYKWNGPKWLIPELTFTQYIELLRISFEEKEKTGEFEVWIDAEEKQKQRM